MKYTAKDYALARELWELSGPKAISMEPGRFYIAKMAVLVAKIRRDERKVKKLRLVK